MKYTQNNQKECNFKERFHEVFTPFIIALTDHIQETALTSRQNLLAHLQSQATPIPIEESFYPSDLEVEIAITKAHISNIKTNKVKASLLELRDLLNLPQKNSSPRIPSMQEQEAFRFLYKVSLP